MKPTPALLTALLLLPLAALHAAGAPDAARPNILFIYADDWGWGDLSCHGHPYIKTPNRVELHQLINDRAEAKDSAKEYPEIVARLTKLALDWKATLPEQPDPACVRQAKQGESQKKGPSKTEQKPAPDRAKAFDRWDTNKDGVLTLEEY